MRHVDTIIHKEYANEPMRLAFGRGGKALISAVPIVRKRSVLGAFAMIALPVLVFGSALPFLRSEGTMAYFSDLEASLNNIFSAGELDFALDPTPWEPAATASSMDPGDEVTRIVDVLKTGSLDFQYTVSTTNVLGSVSFCDALKLTAELGTTTMYIGPLKGFFAGPTVFSDPDAWNFTAVLSSSSPVFASDVCDFDFVYMGWQKGTASSSGFTRTRTLSNRLQVSGASGTSTVVDEGAAIADAEVSKKRPDDNEADSDHLEVKSKKNEDKRVFIRFNINLPSSVKVLYANMRLFMSHNPPEPRTLEARRALQQWSEYEVTWNNKPNVTTSTTASAVAPKQKNVWVSWDMTNDLRGFTTGSFPNYGWEIRDAIEGSNSTKQETFRSREDDNNRRPVLEVAFVAPIATTTHVVINEVYSRVADDDKGDDPENEWVELYNPTDETVSLGGWRLCDASACDILPATTTLAAKQFALVSPKVKTWTYWPSIPAGALKIVINSSIGNGLSNSSDAVILRNASNTIVDAMNYQDVTAYHPYMKNVKPGNTFSRIIKGYDTDQTADWFENISPNPGTNPSEGGMEIMRFSDEGVEVAPLSLGLSPLPEGVPTGAVFTTSDEEEAEELLETITIPESAGASRVSLPVFTAEPLSSAPLAGVSLEATTSSTSTVMGVEAGVSTEAGAETQKVDASGSERVEPETPVPAVEENLETIPTVEAQPVVPQEPVIEPVIAPAPEVPAEQSGSQETDG